MSGFAGFGSFEKDVSKDKYMLENMSLKLKKQELEEEGIYINENIALSYLKKADNKSKKHPMDIKYENTSYTIIAYEGQIYNKEDIKKELENIGYEFTESSDVEVLLKAFIHFGISVLKILNGVFSFAIWDDKTKQLYLARDHFGIKPLYYTILNKTIVFASEIKSILEYPKFEIELDNMGICEMFGLRTSSYTWNVCV